MYHAKLKIFTEKQVKNDIFDILKKLMKTVSKINTKHMKASPRYETCSLSLAQGRYFTIL